MKRKSVTGMSLKIYINKTEDAKNLAREMAERFHDEKDIDIFLIPSMGTIGAVAEVLKGSGILYGVQNIAPIENGAMTGEFSLESAVDLGCSLVELGHAERKNIFKETYEMIAEKVRITLKAGLIPVICVGETEKSAGRKEALRGQVSTLLKGAEKDQMKKIILAYEPEWAIGKEKSAQAGYVHESLGMLREIIRDIFGDKAADEVRIIYGGSVSRDNAAELVSSEDADGLFIGRFGHDMDNLSAIIEHVRKSKGGNQR